MDNLLHTQRYSKSYVLITQPQQPSTNDHFWPMHKPIYVIVEAIPIHLIILSVNILVQISKR